MAAVVDQIILDQEKSYEIVAGHPEEKEMPGARHGAISTRLIIRLGSFVESHNLGIVFTETNFKIGENERIPDIAFVTADRIPQEGIPENGWESSPDLAIEVISHSDLQEKVSDKVLQYLAAGVRQVWLVSPKHRSISIFRSQTDVQIFSAEMNLMSEGLLPGFKCSLNELFLS
jgi:Uma2 family endonuclease